jgi:hypothetical protein
VGFCCKSTELGYIGELVVLAWSDVWEDTQIRGYFGVP